jgi:hypothetical protein
MEAAQVPERQDRGIVITGAICALGAIVIPILGLAGLILGIIAATKPGRGTQGAAIILCSILLGSLSAVYCYDHILSSQTASQSTQSGVHEGPNGEAIIEGAPTPGPAPNAECQAAHDCVGENEPEG